MEIPHYYARMIYLDRIKPFIDTQIIKVLVGQRRVGKSFMLFQLMDYIRGKNANADILYINKELFEFDSLRDYTDLMYYIQKHREGKTGKCYLFIDEVQDIISFEKALRGLLADGRYDIYCTGSNARMLSGELATFLSGRYVEFRIWGLNYSEFMQFHQLEDSDETFSRYYKFGGLPYLVNLPFDEGIVSEYLRGIYNTILLKDIVDRYGIRNVRQLQDLTVYLADTIGNMFSASSISEERMIADTYTNLSHDIRTPLTSMDGYFQLLETCSSEADRKRYIEIIEERIESLKEMLEELFTYTKLKNETYELKKERQNLTQILKETVFSYYDEWAER